MEEFQKQVSGTEDKVSEVQKGYINKVKELEERFNATEAKLRTKAERSEKESICSDVATLFKSKKIALPLISSRISFDVVDGESKAVYLDDMGNKTDWTKEEFKQNLLDDEDLYDNLIGTRSTGSSASSSNNPRGSASAKPSELTAQEVQEWMNRDAAGYMKALKAETNSNKN